MNDIDKQIEELEAQKSGDMIADMELMDRIHQLKMEKNNVAPSCGLDDDECLECGS